jgi:HEAT repeats
MTARTRLHRLLDFAINSYKEHHPDRVSEVDPDDDDDLWEATIALRERDRTIARPIILRTLGSILDNSRDASFREDAARYLGEFCDYYEDNAAVIRALIMALYDADDRVRIAAAASMGGMGSTAVGALPALRAITETSDSAELEDAIQEAIARIQESD